MSKVKAIAFSDFQMEDWPNYDLERSRLAWHEDILKEISRVCQRYRVPALFCGDLFDNPKAIKNQVLESFIYWYKDYFESPGVQFIGISGNHDQCYSNRIRSQSPNYLTTFSEVFETFNCVDFQHLDLPDQFLRIHGIPYLTNEDGFDICMGTATEYKSPMYYNLLLIHRDLWGAKEPNGFQRDEIRDDLPQNMSKWFKHFDLVLSGHIHKPQKLGKNVYMLGATHQQRKSDMNTSMGYWIVYEKDNQLKMKFKPLDKQPQFKYGTEPDGSNMIVPEPPKIVTAKPQGHNYTEFNPRKLAMAYSKAEGLEPGDYRTKLLMRYLGKNA